MEINKAGKWYFECGDILSVQIKEDQKGVMFFKNPIMIEGHTSAGDFFLKVSMPLTDTDIKEITNALRQLCSQPELPDVPCPECGVREGHKKDCSIFLGGKKC